MRGVFLKIYLAFMVTSLVATVVTLLLSAYYREWSNNSINLVAPTGGYISSAELILQTGGEPLLLEWLMAFERHPSVNAYVFDDRGMSLIPSPPELVQNYALAADSYDALINPLGRTEVLVKAPITAANGRVYLLVVEFLHPLAVFNLPAYLGWGLLASLLLFALWGWLLSSYLTRPLLALQKYVRRFAGGSLDFAINPRLLQRQDELGELSREFGGMASKLSRVLADQRQLIRDVSHELRSPLARMAVALELARMDAVPEQQEYLDRIELENQRLDELIGDLLGMARLEVDPSQHHWQSIACQTLLQQIIADAQFEQAEATLQVSFPDHELSVRGDITLLRAALENLIRNALLHTRIGTPVDITVEAKPTSVNIAIRDHGPGVPEDVLPLLLRPFYRNEDARERQADDLQRGHRGFGLGLAIAHRVIVHHGGELQLANHPNGGLVAHVTLPRVATAKV